MILRPRKTKADPRPLVVLLCDEPDPSDGKKACMEREFFQHGTEGQVVSHWIKRHGWSIAYKGHGKFHHRCPICERLSKAPAAYFDRIAS